MAPKLSPPEKGARKPSLSTKDAPPASHRDNKTPRGAVSQRAQPGKSKGGTDRPANAFKKSGGDGADKATTDATKADAARPVNQAALAFETTLISAEMSAVVHAAMQAALETALAEGVPKDKADIISQAVTRAAIKVLDPDGDEDLILADNSVPVFERIENALARAVKQNAVRTMDIFRDWDTDNDGTISKKEFRKALKSLGVEGDKDDYDKLFDQWDVDGSGALDHKELEKALRKASTKVNTIMKEIKEEGGDSDAAFSTINAAALKGGVKAAAVKDAKEEAAAAKEKNKERVLSPRSWQLKEMAEREAAMAAAAEAAKINAEDEDQTTWTVPKFLASKGITKVIAAAMDLPPRKSGDTSHFNYIRNLTKERIVEVLTLAKLEGLADFVYSCAQSLSEQKTGSAAELNDKFASSAKFQMTYGSLSLFYGGLESLLGPPKMYKGPQHEDRTLFNTMEMEHLSGEDAELPFTATTGTSTTSKQEWEIVTTPTKGTEYPERAGYRENHPTWCRVPVKLDEMMETMESKCNDGLRKAGHPEMIKEELVAGRLYTGPMYVKYNTVLRSKSKDVHMVKMAKELTKGNGYPTSIHACNSCVIKLSKLTKAGKVWRGIKDAMLPKEFWVPNDMGVRGGIEYAFSSTTTDRDQAMAYAGAGSASEKDACTIFEMQMGMVDRGADLTWLSQYPHEREVLLPPLTGIEALGTDVDGSLMIIHSRLSLNLASHTLEQVLSRRRKMLLDMTDGIELEMRDSLGEDLVKKGIQLLKKALEYGPLAKDPEWFNDDENFAHCMQQTLYLQHGIVNEIKPLSADGTSLAFKAWKMRGPSRVLLLAGWAFCKGAVRGEGEAALSIDLRDAQLSASEAEQLAELLQANQKLTSIDLRGNESMGLAGAAHLTKFMGSLGRGVTHVPRSLCGVLPANSTLEIPKEPAEVHLRILCAELHSHIWSEGVSAGMGGKKNIQLNRRGISAANEWQPFLWACKENRLDIAECLLDEFACDINEQQPITTSSNQYSALHWCCMKGLENMVEWLVQRGAKKDLKDKHNNTPLRLAESKGNAAIITMLGGDPNAKMQKTYDD